MYMLIFKFQYFWIINIFLTFYFYVYHDFTVFKAFCYKFMFKYSEIKFLN
jgi:hypothetical protein